MLLGKRQKAKQQIAAPFSNIYGSKYRPLGKEQASGPVMHSRQVRVHFCIKQPLPRSAELWTFEARVLTLDRQRDAGRRQQVVAVVEDVLVLEAEADAPRLDRPLAEVLRGTK